MQVHRGPNSEPIRGAALANDTRNTPNASSPYLLQFGLLLADGRNGPFRCEVQFVRALATFDRSSCVLPTQDMVDEADRRERQLRLEHGDGTRRRVEDSGAPLDLQQAAAEVATAQQLAHFRELREKGKLK